MRICALLLLISSLGTASQKNTTFGLNLFESTDISKNKTFLSSHPLRCFLSTSGPNVTLTRSGNLMECHPTIELQNNDVVYIPESSTATVSIPHLKVTPQLSSGNNLVMIDIIKFIELKSGGNIRVPNATAFVGNAKRKYKTFVVSENKYSYFNNTRPRDSNFILHE